MELADLRKKAEAVLFSAGRKIDFEDIRKLCRCREPELLKQALSDLKEDYDRRDTSLMITEHGTSWKMIVKEQYAKIMRRIVSDTELPKTIMETLAVIAWKNPVLQSDVIKIRTNKAYDHLNELEKMGFISRKKHGRTKEIKLTDQFLKYFELEGDHQIKEAFKEVKDIPLPEDKKEGTPLDVYEGPEASTPEIPKEEGLDAVEEMESEHLGELQVFDASKESPPAEMPGENDAPKEVTADPDDLEEGSEFDEIVEEKHTPPAPDPEIERFEPAEPESAGQQGSSDDQGIPELDQPVLGETESEGQDEDSPESEDERSETAKLDDFKDMLDNEEKEGKK